MGFTTSSDFVHSFWPSHEAAPLSRLPRIPHYFALREGVTLAEILHYPYSLFLETGEQQTMKSSLTGQLNGSPDFSISLKSSTAYFHNTAHCIAQTLNERFGLQGYKSMQIETCLQEAVINAVVHGNLGINSSFQSNEGMNAHYMQVESRLKQSHHADKRIQCAAWDKNELLQIAIADQGEGFDFTPSKPGETTPHGRGLFLIQSLADRVWVGEDRRTLFMTFTY